MKLGVHAFALSTLLVASSARADGASETDRQVAQSLFEQARALLEAGKPDEACPKLEESQRLDPGGGTLLNLAVCYELAGRMASAQNRFLEGLALAVRDGRKEREELARAHLADIAPKIMRVALVVPPALAEKSPTLTLDGSRVPQAGWDAPIAIDPGPHRIVVAGPGVASWQRIFTANEPGRTYRIDIDVGSPSSTSDSGTDQPKPPEEGGRSVAFWVVGGLGVAGLLAGGGLGVAALSANTDAKNGCVPERSYCTSEGRDAAERARTMAWASTIAMGVGAVAIGVAFLLPRRSVAVQATPTAHGGAMVALSFVGP